MRVVTLKELIRRASATTQTPEDMGQKMVASLLDLASKELEQGNRVELDKTLAPLVLRRAPTPGVKAASAAPVRPDGYKISLVMPKKDFFASLVAGRLTGPRSKAEVFEGVESFMGSLSGARPDLVVVDGSLAGAKDLVRAVKRSKETSSVGIILIRSESSEAARTEGLRICEDESVTEPFELSELVELAESEIRRSQEERTFFQHQVHFQLPTRDDAIEEANDTIGAVVEQSGMSEERGAALAVAFREALDNGARHGNKSQESRLIEVVYLLDKEKVTITVMDEGDGFDTEMYLRRGVHGNAVAVARERNEAGRTGGLGIMLMLKCLDNLEYNYAGNQVKLTKYVK
ncbi:MAG TPA: ATP-binding protein [Planctomycetota bacterium]|nr:ATP-binding protein [Planctomycetota bacterium]